MSVNGDEFHEVPDSRAECFIGLCKGFVGVCFGMDCSQVFIVDDHQRIHVLGHFLYAFQGLSNPTLVFEVERHGHDADSEYAQLL